MRHYNAYGVHQSILLVVRGVVRIGRGGSVRISRACRPVIERVVDGVVAVVAPGAGNSMRPLTRYAVAGGAIAGTLALARAFAGPGLSELIEIVAAISVGAIAVSAALAVRRSRRALPTSSRALIIAATKSVAAEHRHLSSTRALVLVCNPRSVLALGAGPLLQKAVRMVVEALLVRPVLQVVPGLGLGLDAVSACRVSVSSVRFIRHFEATAATILLDSAA
jgi:hypothetical protein